MKRIREKEQEEHHTLCEPCAHVHRMARETREIPGKGMYRLMDQFIPCAHSATTWRAGVRPFLTAAQRQVLDEDSDEDTVELAAPSHKKFRYEPPLSPSLLDVAPPSLPAQDDLLAWRALNGDYSCVQQWFTAGCMERYWHVLPRYLECRTDFEGDKHDYYVRGVHVNGRDDPQRWRSPSSLLDLLYPEFEDKFRSRRSAETRIRDAIVRHVGAPEKQGMRVTPLLAHWPLLLLATAAQRQAFRDSALLLFLCQKSEPRRDSLRHTWVQFMTVHHWLAQDGMRPEDQNHWVQWQQDLIEGVAKDIRRQWKGARDGGSLKHMFYEFFLLHQPLPAGAILPLGYARAMAWLAVKYDVFGCEVNIFDDQGQLVGCVDLILIERATGRLLLADYKNTKVRFYRPSNYARNK